MTRAPTRSAGKGAVPAPAAEAQAGPAVEAAGAVPDAVPLTAEALAPLRLMSPRGGVSRGLLPGALAAIRDRLCLALPGTILSARPEAPGWDPVFETPRRPLTPETARLAEKLGFVADGHAAAAMGVTLPQDHALGPFVAVLRGAGEGKEALYCGTSSIWGGRILRSDDGRRFVPVCADGMGDAANVAMSALAGGDGWLVAAPGPVWPAERRKGPLNADREVRIFGSMKPVPGKWAEVAPPGLGAGLTGGVGALAVAFGHVYAAVEDPDRGFSLWRAAPRPELPWTWEKVLDRGGYRYSHNPAVTRMVAFGGALYLSAGISATGFGKDLAGPAAAEILRIDPDGNWEVIVGSPRFTPDGLKVPLAGLGPGFGDGFATLVPGLAAYEGVLYAGTCSVAGQYREGPDDQRRPPAGGAALWATIDGETWAPVLESGADPAVVSVGGLAPTPTGFAAALLSDPGASDSRDGAAPGPGAGLELRVLHSGPPAR